MKYTTINHDVDTQQVRAYLEAAAVAARKHVVARVAGKGTHEAVATLVSANRRYVRYVVTRC